MVSTFARHGVSKNELTNGFTMREIPLMLEHFRRAEARDDLRLLNVNALPHIQEDFARDAAFDELFKQAYGSDAERDKDDLPTYLPSIKPDIAKLRAFVSQGDM